MNDHLSDELFESVEVRLLRETLREREASAPVVPNLAARARSAARRTQALNAIVSAAAVVVVAAGGLLLVDRGAGVEQQLPSAARPSAEPSFRSVPDGWKRVSSLGVQLSVPADWPVAGAVNGCGALPTALVVRGSGAVRGCSYVEPKTLTLVEIGRAERLSRSGVGDAPGAKASPVPLNVLPVMFTEQPLADGRTELLLEHQDPEVAVVLRGPDKSLLQKIMGTIEFVDVDAAGCAAQLSARPDWDQPRPGAKVHLGTVNSVSVCLYAGLEPATVPTRLAASRLATGAGAADLAALVDAAKAGHVPDVPQNCVPGLAETAFLVLIAHSADGDVPMRVHFQNCVGRYVASPTGVSQVSLSLLAAVFNPLGIGYATNEGLPQ